MNQLDGLVGGDGYVFAQRGSNLQITFSVPPTTKDSDLEFSLDPDSREICAGIRDDTPTLLGVLFQPATRESIDIRNGSCIITLAIESGAWPVVIADRSARGIDAHSLFLLALWYCTQQKTAHAKEYLLEGVQSGSVKAILLLSRFYLTGNEDFAIQIDQDLALSTLDQIPERYRTPQLNMDHARILHDCHRIDQAIQILRTTAETSQTARWGLIAYLREIRTDSPSADAEIATHLEVLQALDDPQAIFDLANCLEAGTGVPRDAARARELRRRLQELEHGLAAPNQKVIQDVPVTLIAAGVGLAVVGIVLAVWLARRRR
jgi:hypothetical protein